MFDKNVKTHTLDYNITLQENEVLHLVVRKHWIILFQSLLYILILFGICISVYIIATYARIPQLLIIMTIIGIFMISIQYIFIQWINNDLDILILTNKRIISYDQINFLNRKLCQTTIDLVQEVNATTSGLFGNILQYGNLSMKTASDSSGAVSDFNMTLIANPLETSRIIHKFIDEYRHSVKN